MPPTADRDNPPPTLERADSQAAITSSLLPRSLADDLATPPAIDLEPLPKDAEKARKVMMANHERANTTVFATMEVQPDNGRFSWSVKLPENLPWSRVTVRAIAVTKTQMAIGVQVLPVGK